MYKTCSVTCAQAGAARVRSIYSNEFVAKVVVESFHSGFLGHNRKLVRPNLVSWPVNLALAAGHSRHLLEVRLLHLPALPVQVSCVGVFPRRACSELHYLTVRPSSSS